MPSSSKQRNYSPSFSRSIDLNKSIDLKRHWQKLLTFFRSIDLKRHWQKLAIGVFLIYLFFSLATPYLWNWKWDKAGPCGDWLNPMFTLVMIFLLYLQLDKVKEDGESKIIFDLIEKYENRALNAAIKAYWDDFHGPFKKNFEAFKNEQAKQDIQAKRLQYRKILYFWKQVAVAYKQGYISFDTLISAFPSMDILELFYPVHELICTEKLQPPHEPDLNIRALRKAYRDDTVKRIMKKDRCSKEEAPKKYSEKFDNIITWD